MEIKQLTKITFNERELNSLIAFDIRLKSNKIDPSSCPNYYSGIAPVQVFLTLALRDGQISIQEGADAKFYSDGFEIFKKHLYRSEFFKYLRYILKELS